MTFQESEKLAQHFNQNKLPWQISKKNGEYYINFVIKLNSNNYTLVNNILKDYQKENASECEEKNPSSPSKSSITSIIHS